MVVLAFHLCTQEAKSERVAIQAYLQRVGRPCLSTPTKEQEKPILFKRESIKKLPLVRLKNKYTGTYLCMCNTYIL